MLQDSPFFLLVSLLKPFICVFLFIYSALVLEKGDKIERFSEEPPFIGGGQSP